MNKLAMGIDFAGISIGVGNSWPTNHIASDRKVPLKRQVLVF